MKFTTEKVDQKKLERPSGHQLLVINHETQQDSPKILPAQNITPLQPTKDLKAVK